MQLIKIMANLSISDLQSTSNGVGEFIRFKDLNIHQGERFKSVDVKNFWAINESILNTFIIPKGSRYMNLEFGSELRTFLFEPLNDTTVDLIGDEVDRLLATIPEINVLQVELDVIDGNAINITVSFVAPSLSRETLEFQLGLDYANESIVVNPDINKVNNGQSS